MMRKEETTGNVIVQIDLSARKVELYYSGKVRTVQAYTSKGIGVSLPMDILIKYVTPGGIFGTFEIEYTIIGNQKKFKRIRKVH